MSGMTTTQMVTDIQSRIPIGLQQPYVLDRLNQSFSFILQQGSFNWAVRRTTLPISIPAATATLPADADPGDMIVLFHANGTVIPFVPPDKWPEQVTFNQELPPNTFSAWTLVNTGTIYQIRLATNAALSGTVILNIFYHLFYAPFGINDEFPTPSEFDSLLLDLTEAEIKRRYNIAGWAEVQQKANEEIKRLVPDYRTDKRTIEGMSDVAMNAQEAQLGRAE